MRVKENSVRERVCKRESEYVCVRERERENVGEGTIGGILYLGSCWFPEPLPYNGITFSREIAALQTGHVWLFGLVSSHWCKHGQLE